MDVLCLDAEFEKEYHTLQIAAMALCESVLENQIGAFTILVLTNSVT